MEIAVEVFEEGQKRSFVRRYQSESLRVGRGWGNDIIVRDPLVDADHLLIRAGEDGQLWVEDLGSTNGTRVGRNSIQGSSRVGFNQPIHLGHSQIRLHRVDQPVAPTLRLNKLDELVAVFRHPVLALLLLAAAVWMGIYTHLVGDPTETAWSERVSQALTLGSGLFIWAIVWGSIARMLRHEMAFWAHLSLASLLLVLSLSGFMLVDWIAFNSLSIHLTEALTGTLIALVLFLATLIGMSITTRMSLRFMGAMATGVAFVALSLVYLLPALDEEPDRDGPEMITVAQKPSLLIVGTRSSEAFLAEAEELFAGLEEELAADRDDASD